jgi:ribosome-associated toxin RatA of RatAB toxin-antitoxin module
LAINRISVLYSTPLVLKKNIFSNRKGRYSLKSTVQAKKLSLLAKLFCVTLAMQPLMVSAPVWAKNNSSASGVTEEIINGKQFCVSHATVNARPEIVWRILTDYANAPRVFPQLKKCQIVEDRGGTKLLRHQVAPSGLPGTYEYVVEVKESAPKSLEWHRVSGSFKEVDGFWKLEPLDGGRSTEVTYSAYVNGGLFIPPPLIRRQFRIDMPGIMASLKSQSEGPPQIAGRPVPKTQ